MHEMTRRNFLKMLGTAFVASSVAGVSLPKSGFATEAGIPKFRIKDAVEATSVCCFCSLGCGGIASVIDGDLVSFEGDPDSPINEGALCSKGAAQFNVVNIYDPQDGTMVPNPRRLTRPKYRAPGATEWQEVEWDWAFKRIAEKVKATRDATFETVSNGVTVNRTQAIGHLGCGALPVEDLGPLQKLQRALGMVYIEHQARL
ncbi:MAG: hypothetical protein FWE46_05115 [Coriobacteriia bacterium]|nr:hypothetical protein [Coriobacteriia bacterium]MCL2537827.1 hypothetical protein [Coriobacteriia bacterium]